MFEVEQNNQPNNQPKKEKKSFGKFGIFLVIFSFICVAGLLHYYVPKILAPDLGKTVVVPKKTDEQKIKEEWELIKKGYSKSVSGVVEEIGENKNKIVIKNNSGGEYSGNLEIFVNEKTSIFEIVYESNSKGEVDAEIVKNETDAETDARATGGKPVLVSFDELRQGEFVEIILPKFVKLEEEDNLVASEIYITGEIQEEKMKNKNEEEEDLEDIDNITNTNN